MGECSALRAKVAKLQTGMDKKESEPASIESHSEQNNDVEELQKNLEKEEAEVLWCEDKIKELEAKVQEISSNDIAYKMETSDEKESVMKDFIQVANQTDKESEEVSDTQEEIDELNKEKASVQSDIILDNEETGILDTADDEPESRVSTEVDELTNNVDMTLTEKNVKLMTEMEILANKNKQLVDSIGMLSEEQQLEDLDDSEDEDDSRISEMTDLASKLSKSTEELKKLTARKEDSESEGDDKKVELEEGNGYLDTLKEAVDMEVKEDTLPNKEDDATVSEVEALNKSDESELHEKFEMETTNSEDSEDSDEQDEEGLLKEHEESLPSLKSPSNKRKRASKKTLKKSKKPKKTVLAYDETALLEESSDNDNELQNSAAEDLEETDSDPSSVLENIESSMENEQIEPGQTSLLTSPSSKPTAILFSSWA